MNLFELFVKIGVDDQASKKMEKISDKIGKGLKKAAAIGTTAIATLGTFAVKTFSDFEQLVGGAELMFGDAFETVMNNAKNAYQTVQMSQNEYLRQVNGFATGLKTALGGNEQAAAELAHRIIQAEADIVAATGNTQENVANAFAGIMKSNFTMLDNLQIGITPTKEGFQEVIDKVNEWNKANGEATNYQMGNLADMQSALVDYIEMVGMSGYAQKEASGTIQGSFASMKAAASDFATSLIDDNADVGESWNKLKETIRTFVDNLKPKINEFLKSISPIATVVASITAAFVAFKIAAGISSLLGVLTKSWKAYKAATEGATIAQWAMNAAMNANPIVLLVTLIAGLVTALVTLWKTNDKFRESFVKAWESIKDTVMNVVNWFKEIKDRFVEFGENIVNGIKEGIVKKWEEFKEWFYGLFDFLDPIKELADSLVNFADSVAGGEQRSKIDGSHRSGLRYVPYDGYIAELHKGERVLNAAEAMGYGSTSFGDVIINIDGAKYNDERSLASAIAYEIQNMTDRRSAVFA